MKWFKRPRYTTISPKAPSAKPPDGLWIKCEECNELIYKKEWERQFKVCPKCKFHFYINPKERINIVLDKGSFKEKFSQITPIDFLRFKDIKSYDERLIEAQKKTSLSDAVLCGTGTIGKQRVAIAVLDFAFMGGSMGSVVGEKISLIAEDAEREGLPLIIFSASGGARMQEGVISLFQMAKTVASINSFKKAGLLYISVLTNPTTGGVAASFAALGDITIAEPKALIGFAGPRVIEQTLRQRLPSGFQRSEFLAEHGMVDIVVERKEMRKRLSELISFFVKE
jgi:acetyl-CoA carboxylase carboxyl transferase subunit beta